ncbi:hypothetical protein QR79_10540 [Methylobacterium indicum]|uniref:Uncharacterized protein n=1 Tax=Methylobacterium indicum TaxID=1775910 RepID=A0ABR5HE70_9HYPH|nr:hypothetical protein QR79_10540 [Methylobacterium indicum]
MEPIAPPRHNGLAATLVRPILPVESRSMMSFWFSRLAALLRRLLPGRTRPDPGSWILLGEGRGVSWWGDADAARPALTGPTPPPAR